MGLVQRIISRIEALRQLLDKPSQPVKLTVAIKNGEKLFYL